MNLQKSTIYYFRCKIDTQLFMTAKYDAMGGGGGISPSSNACSLRRMIICNKLSEADMNWHDS